MTTFTVNTNNRKLEANSDSYTISDLVTPVILDVMDNDILGITPTTITTIDTSLFLLGSVVINVGDLNVTFTPNGVIGSSSFTYTIEDDLSRTSTGVVTITTTT